MSNADSLTEQERLAAEEDNEIDPLFYVRVFTTGLVVDDSEFGNDLEDGVIVAQKALAEKEAAQKASTEGTGTAKEGAIAGQTASA